MSRSFSSCSSASRRDCSVVELFLRELAHLGIPPRRAPRACFDARATTPCTRGSFDQRLELREGLRVLAVFGLVALDSARAERLASSLVALFDGCQFVQHVFVAVYALESCVRALPPETGGRNATSSPSDTVVSMRA